MKKPGFFSWGAGVSETGFFGKDIGTRQRLFKKRSRDGEDTPLYLEKLLKKAIQELETIAGEEWEE